ncbi:MAG: T9SS C-terminal target domain-containing protein [Balneolaceae bacterium]|nr:MAG: T9SS C-terminal target domain-containing protein [Balneolaceae bacterium]
MLTDDGGDGKILSFQSPRITFTDDECWRTLSSPFEGLTYATVLNDIWTQGSLNSNYPDGDPNVYFFNINTNDYEAVADLNTVIAPGQGFLVSVFQDDEFGVPGSFDKALDRIRGKEHGDDAPATVTPTLNTSANGWTLLGNPYATPIDFDLITKANLTNVAYVYDNANSNWVSSSPISGIGDFNGRISPFQGFFVQTASSGTPSVTFNDDAKVPKQSATFFGKENASSEVHYVRLQLEGEELKTSAWIVLDEFGDDERYAYGDALQLRPYADDFAILATRKLDDTLMDIGVYPQPSHVSGDFEIPVYIETTKPGRFTLTATDLNLPFTMDGLVLYDRERGVEIPIGENMEYQFELIGAQKANLIGVNNTLSCNLAGIDLAIAGSPNKAKVTDFGTTRFVIRLADAKGTSNEIPVYIRLNQNYPNPFNPGTQIQFELPQRSEVRLEVYDMTGRQIASLVNETVQAGIHTVNFDASNLSSGVYIYRLQAGSVVLTRKLTLIK